MAVLFRHSSQTAMFSRFLTVATATLHVMYEIDKGGFLSELNVSMLKGIIALVWDFIQFSEFIESGKIQNLECLEHFEGKI